MYESMLSVIDDSFVYLYTCIRCLVSTVEKCRYKVVSLSVKFKPCPDQKMEWSTF